MCSRTLVEKIEKYVFTLVKTIQNDDQNCCSGDIKLLPCALHDDGDGDHYEGNKLAMLGDAIAISKSETITHSLTH